MSVRRSWLGLAAAALALVVVLAGLLPPVLAQPAPQAGPRVVTSTSVLADLVQQVGGDRLAAVQSLVPAGVDVEDYDPKPGDLQAVAQASLLVMNGLALDRWVTKLVQSANPDVNTLVL